MRKSLLILLTLFITSVTYAQWPKVYGQNSYDMIVRSIHESYDRGIYVTGAERRIDEGPFNGYILKTDINGNFLWKRYINDPSWIVVLGLSQTNDDGIFVTGQTLTDWTGNSNGFYMKLNSCGDKEWCRIVEIPGHSACVENIALSDGSFIVQGEHDETYFDRIWLYKIDQLGNFLWAKTLEPDTSYFHETGYNLLLTNDSCILISGFAVSLRDPGSPYGWQTPFWVKMDLEGNQLWDLPWFNSTHIEGDNGLTIQDNFGNYYSAGSYGIGPGQHACFYKISPEGYRLNYRLVSELGDASGCKTINFYKDSTLFMGGNYAINGNGYSMVLRCDTSGNTIKNIDVPLFGNPVDNSFLTEDNKIVASGERPQTSGSFHWEICLFKFNQDLEYDSVYTIPLEYDSLCPHVVIPEDNFDLDCGIVSVEEPLQKPENSSLKVYPLPANDQVTISLPDTYVVEEYSHHIKTTTIYYQLKGNKSLEIYNLSGQKVASRELPDGQNSLTLNVNDWSPGLYLARLVHKGKIVSQGKILLAR